MRWNVKRRSGFTLIEVMIVAAVGVVLLGAVFAVNFRITDMWRSERQRQALQQNFRFAADRMTSELRQATVVSVPNQNELGDILTFDYIKTPAPSETRSRVSYERKKNGDRYYVERAETPLIWNAGAGTWDVSPSPIWTRTPVTEEITTLAAVHFVHRGARVVTILVAQYQAGGMIQTTSYTLQTAIRTLPLYAGGT